MEEFIGYGLVGVIVLLLVLGVKNYLQKRKIHMIMKMRLFLITTWFIMVPFLVAIKTHIENFFSS